VQTRVFSFASSNLFTKHHYIIAMLVLQGMQKPDRRLTIGHSLLN